MPVSASDIAGIVRTVRRHNDLLRYARYMLIYNLAIYALIMTTRAVEAARNGSLAPLGGVDGNLWPVIVLASVGLTYLSLAMRWRLIFGVIFAASVAAYAMSWDDKPILITALIWPAVIVYDPTQLPLAPLATRLFVMIMAMVYVMACFVLFSVTWLRHAGRTPAAAYEGAPSLLGALAPGQLLETRLPGLRLQRTTWLERSFFALAALLFVTATMAIFYQARAVQNEYGGFISSFGTTCAPQGVNDQTRDAVLACVAARYTWVGTAATMLAPVAVLVTALVLAHALRRLARRRFLRRLAERPVTPDGATLFLRAFRDDQVSVRRASRNLFSIVFDLGRTPATLDELMLERLDGRGDLIAIGNPQDRRGTARHSPWGAHRLYVDDAEWQQTVARLAVAAERIVLCVDESAGVRWEIAHLIDNGHGAKTLFVFNPELGRDARLRLLVQSLGAPPAELAGVDGADVLAATAVARGDVRLMLCRRPERDAFIVAARLAFARAS